MRLILELVCKVGEDDNEEKEKKMEKICLFI